ncbi:hypothetical protein AKUH1B105A_04660 [Apilactobacillus kunkeei]|nr:hypothetical protein AKUH1B105A_04660 [Apilactobacillus kunkeei]
MTKTNVPRLRFNGFSDEWKEIKFSEIYTKSYGGGTPSKKNQDFWNDGTIPWFQSSDLVEGKLTKENVNKKISEKAIVKSSVKVIPGGSIAIVTRVGVGKLALIDFDYSTSQDFLSISGFKTKTMYALYLIYNLMNVLKNSLQGTSIKGITKPELNSKRIRISADSLEQQKIGDFFAKQDKLIELQTQKVEQLKKLKRGYLQKMFPQEGETVPRLRFSGFSGEWKEKNLVELLKIGKSGGTPSTRNKEFYKGEIPFLSIKDVTTSNGTIFDTEKHISQEAVDNSSTWIVPKNALTLSMYASVGSVAKFTTNIATSQAFFNMVFNENVFVDYMYHFLKYYDYCGKWNRLIAKGTQGNLNATDIKNIIVFVPKLDEQQKIGSFFAKIDKLIEEQSNKLVQLKQQKKAYLQKMFI